MRQAWEKWPLNLVFPMLYHSFYREPIEWVGRGVAEGIAALPASTPVIAGVCLRTLLPPTSGRPCGALRAAPG